MLWVVDGVGNLSEKLSEKQWGSQSKHNRFLIPKIQTMRVVKADLVYALTRQPLSSCTALHLDGLKVESLSFGLVQIPNLLVLRVNDNNIKNILDIELEGNLWELHARGNVMDSISLGGRRAMGVLDLGKNKLTEEELGR